MALLKRYLELHDLLPFPFRRKQVRLYSEAENITLQN